MEGISDIRIIGFDAKRPPRVRKEPYINLFFELTHKAPLDWCNTFNNMTSKLYNTTTIKPTEGLYIESWVRKPDEIEGVLQELKNTVNKCNDAYIKRIELETSTQNSTGAEQEEEGEQGRLNRIISALNFDA